MNMKNVWMEVRHFFKTIDLFLLFSCLAASIIGLILVSSAARTMPEGAGKYVAVQGGAIVLGVVLYLLFSLTNVDTMSRHWRWLTGVGVGLMLLLVPFGVAVRGNKSWLRPPFLPVGIQPAEVAKILFILILAYEFHVFTQKDRLNRPLSIGVLVGTLLCASGLIFATSKDGGMIVIYVFIFLSMCLAGGVKLRWFAALGAVIAAAVPFAWYGLMEEHQRQRLLVGFNPDLDPLDKGWQSILSRISIGGGQLYGQGLYNGTQTQIGRLSDQQTDFIFAVAGEEFGLIGCLVILLILSVIIIRCLYVSTKAKTGLSSLVCVGVAGMLLFQTIINVGMCLALTPVIGLTLPFISSGGSSVVTMFIAMGLVSSVRRHPKRHWLKD